MCNNIQQYPTISTKWQHKMLSVVVHMPGNTKSHKNGPFLDSKPLFFYHRTTTWTCTCGLSIVHNQQTYIIISVSSISKVISHRWSWAHSHWPVLSWAAAQFGRLPPKAATDAAEQPRIRRDLDLIILIHVGKRSHGSQKLFLLKENQL